MTSAATEMLSFEEALSTVREKIKGAAKTPGVTAVPLAVACGRVLANDVPADRDTPPFHRSTRDGFAVRSSDFGKSSPILECIGEVQAGGHFDGEIMSGQCVEIMTGAPLPGGADAVVMIEHVERRGSKVQTSRSVRGWDNIVRKGSEAQQGSVILRRGRRLGAGEIGLLASVGQEQVNVFAQPCVAILPTGDEVVPVAQKPEWFQIRNSNAATLSALAESAGGIPVAIGIAPDEKQALHRMIEQGLESDLLLLSGGVSMGKYDLVEDVLKELGAEFYFHGIAIRPGKPLVFGSVRDKFFFGLPGNPVSTYVTFELFAKPAIAMLAGAEAEDPVFLRAKLGKPLRQKLGLTAFMPARLETENADPVVNLVGWQGSGDLVGAAAANCFLVVHPEQTDLTAGDWVDVLPKAH